MMYSIRTANFAQNGHAYPGSLVLAHNMNYGQIPFSIDRRVKHLEKLGDQVVHWHDYVQIWYTVRGRYEQRVFDQSFLLKPGSLITIPPFLRHDIYSNGQNFEVICINVSMRYLKKLFGNSDDLSFLLRPVISRETLSPVFLFSGALRDTLEELLLSIHSEYKENAEKCLIVSREKIIRLFQFIVENYQKTGTLFETEFFSSLQPYLDPICEALNYTGENFQKRIYMEDISKHTLMSKSRFSAVFKRFTGMSFTDYAALCRIFRASLPITNTNASLAEIAATNGFHNLKHFYQQFKYYMGATPSTFREASREMYITHDTEK